MEWNTDIAVIEQELLDAVVSSVNLTGATVANLEDDPDSPDANWATATTVADTELRAGFPTPAAAPATGADLQQFRVLLRKNATGGGDPTYDIELWETGGGAALATLISGATLTSDTGEVVSATWDASLLGTADGSAVELRVVGIRSGGSPSNRRTVEIGAAEWNAKLDAPAASESELYFLRARYYDPETGRFIRRDLMQFDQRYAYACALAAREGATSLRVAAPRASSRPSASGWVNSHRRIGGFRAPIANRAQASRRGCTSEPRP